ncbi:MAG: hypothetical protein DRQ78_01200 [Epsilonproteobacteria bacterium]|nr:MAG: hypothetical protein DRQ78_01200 [Campylobacterota bacterium]
MTQTLYLTLLITSIIAIIVFIFVLLYLVSLIRRVNIVMKKVDYLVEDITYKSESLNVGVNAINKVASYVLAADAIGRKSYKSAMKLVSENRNYIFTFLEKLKENTVKPSGKAKPSNKKASPKKATTSKNTAKQPAKQKPTNKKK